MTAPSNEKVGQLLGVSHATISRYRSGDRLPELDTMAKIAETLGWSLDAQWKSRQSGQYAAEFSQRVDAYYSVGTVGQEAAPDQPAG